MTKLLVAVLAVAGALNVMAAYVVQPLGSVEQVTEAAAAGSRVLNIDKTSPPMPTDFKGMVEAVGKAREVVELRPDVAMDHIVAAAAKRAVVTQRMARVQGEMVAAIETDKAGNKVAKIVRDDGSVEMRKLKVLHTARVQAKKVEPGKGSGRLLDGALALAIGAAMGGGAAMAMKRGSGDVAS